MCIFSEVSTTTQKSKKWFDDLAKMLNSFSPLREHWVNQFWIWNHISPKKTQYPVRGTSLVRPHFKGKRWDLLPSSGQSSSPGFREQLRPDPELLSKHWSENTSAFLFASFRAANLQQLPQMTMCRNDSEKPENENMLGDGSLENKQSTKQSVHSSNRHNLFCRKPLLWTLAKLQSLGSPWDSHQEQTEIVESLVYTYMLNVTPSRLT